MSSDCRILYLLGQLQPGGQERQLCYLLQAMNRSSYRPFLAVWNYKTRNELYVSEIRRLGVPLHACSDDASTFTKLKELRRWVLDLQPEVIHSYCFYMNVVAWWLARTSKAIAIGSIRQDFVDERWRVGGMRGKLVGRLSARLPPFQVFNSWSAKKAAEECQGFYKPTRMYVVPNGIDTEKIKSLPATQTKRVIAIGRLEPIKRWDRLLRATAALSNRKFDFSVQLIGDGPLRADLELEAQNLGLNGRVQFLGYRQDVLTLLEESAFLVHTADAEGCPNVILEAMAAGRAAIATDAGDASYLIENGVTGFVVPRGDDAALVNRIAKLMDDPELSRRMGQAARLRAEREFCLDRLVASTLAAYRAAGWQE